MPNWCEETEDENENASTDGYLQGLTASGLQHAHELEETSVAVGRARKNQPQGWRKIHSLGIAHIWNQLGAEARQKNRATWRATGWWPDHYSVAIYDIAEVPGGSKLKFTQIGVPPNRYSGHYRGWIEAYWTPMKEMFATGRTSERTKRRVKIDREERIKGGKFRRSISKKA